MFRDEKYRTFVREHPCENCGRVADVAHHFGKRIGGGGTGLKPHDTFEVPLCNSCHQAEHNNVLTAEQYRDTEHRFLVRALRIATEWIEQHAAKKNR